MIVELKRKLKEELSSTLYHHCEGVAETASTLASQLKIDENKAVLAAWLHDYAREWPDEELLVFAKKHNIQIDSFHLQSPILLHGPIASKLSEKLGIGDPDVLAAISNHTLGCAGMSPLQQIIFVADKIEPNRDYPGVQDLRNLVEKDFQYGLISVLQQSITYNVSRKLTMHPLTVEFWNELVLGEGSVNV